MGMDRKILDPAAEMKGAIGARLQPLEKGGLQIAAVHDPIRGAITEGGAGTDGRADDLAGIMAAKHANFLRRHHGGSQAFGQSQIDQDAGRVGGELDAGSDRLERFRLFEHRGSEPAADQRERAGEPADPGSGDHYGP